MFIYARVCISRKYSYGQFIKKLFTRPFVRVYMLGKVYSINMFIVGRSKENKNLTLLTYMRMRVCIYVRDRKYGPFVFKSSSVQKRTIIGDNVSRSWSQLKNVACLFAFVLCTMPSAVCRPCLGSGMP